MAVDRGAFWCGPSRQGRLIRQDTHKSLKTIWRHGLRHRPGIENAVFSESIREEYLFGFLMLDNRAIDRPEVAGGSAGATAPIDGPWT